jgi:ribosome-binding protein aMBF1 (putative translation factor)
MGKAAWVRAQRKALGWPQSRLAEELEVDVGTVSRWERGDLEVDRRTVLAIERLVDVQTAAKA